MFKAIGWLLSLLNETPQIARILGVPVKVHTLTIAMLVFAGLSDPSDLWILGVLYASVVAHEYGHAVVARHYQMTLKDIVLYPFGGILSIEPHGQRGLSVMLVSIAGPLISVVIGLSLLIPLSLGYECHESVTYISKINFTLAAFNMLPFFPLDGSGVVQGIYDWWNDRRFSHLPEDFREALQMHFRRRAIRVISAVGFAGGVALLFTGYSTIIGIFVMLLSFTRFCFPEAGEKKSEARLETES